MSYKRVHVKAHIRVAEISDDQDVEPTVPFARQVSIILNMLEKAGRYIPRAELVDVLDRTLNYEENKAIAMELFGLYDEPMGELDVLKEQAERHHASRSPRARRRDYGIRARKTFTVRQAVRDEEKADKWFGQPNRYDIEGIDVAERGKKR